MSVLGQVCRVVRHNIWSPPSFEGLFPLFPGQSTSINKTILKRSDGNVPRAEISHSSTGTPIDSCCSRVTIYLWSPLVHGRLDHQVYLVQLEKEVEI